MTKLLGNLIRRTSRKPIVDCFQNQIGQLITQGQLIDATNPLLGDAVKAIKNHVTSTTTPLSPSSGIGTSVPSTTISTPIILGDSEVVNYVSASVLSHLIDGWNYLANSCRAYLEGNAGVAIHLAYYAELRAVMSILAAEGVGVFDSQHVGILPSSAFTVFDYLDTKKHGKRDKRRLGTHIFAWDALSKWCKSSIRPSVDLLELFSIKGKSFREFVQNFHPSASPIATDLISKKWLLEWALDVKRYRMDRETRNDVSYRPQSINKFQYRFNAKNAVHNVFKVFGTLSPIGQNPFYYLDIELLRRLLTDLYGSHPAISSSGTFEDLLEGAFSNLGETLDFSTKQLLTQPTTSGNVPLLFRQSKKGGSLPLPVISRATLLLRVATGFSSKILLDSNTDKNSLGFIWRSHGVNNGFWSPSAPIEDFPTLWNEVESAFQSVAEDLELCNTSLQQVREKSGEAFTLISQLNRAVLWGI